MFHRKFFVKRNLRWFQNKTKVLHGTNRLPHPYPITWQRGRSENCRGGNTLFNWWKNDLCTCGYNLSKIKICFISFCQQKIENLGLLFRLNAVNFLVKPCTGRYNSDAAFHLLESEVLTLESHSRLVVLPSNDCSFFLGYCR